jgi:aspartate/methionine/tyrosine aminotransferase
MISERARQVKPFIVMDVLEKARDMESKGKEVIHLEVGEPDFQTPKLIEDAAVKSIEGG